MHMEAHNAPWVVVQGALIPEAPKSLLDISSTFPPASCGPLEMQLREMAFRRNFVWLLLSQGELRL